MKKGLKKEVKDQLLFAKIKQAYEIKEREKEQYINEQNSLNDLMNNMGNAKITVAGRACRGVHITMDNVHYSVPDTVSNVKFFREANEIIMQ